MLNRPIRSALLCALAALTLPACARDASPDHDPEPYLRVRDAEETGGAHLQIALRTFRRGPNEPRVTLVGVAHIGQPEYYRALEERLDAHDLVLFEGVGPIWAALDADASDRDKAAATESRIRLIATRAMQRAREGEAVRTVEDLWRDTPGYEARLIKASSVDAWGNPLRFELSGDDLTVESLGADGEPGGSGYDADISLSDQPPIQEAEIEQGDGLQNQIAQAAGLVFQLTAMDYDKPHWVNSDTTAEALSYALAGHDPDDARPGGGGPATGGGEPLFDLLSGRGFFGKLIGGMLKFVGASPQSRAMLRLLLIETLANADEMMGLAGNAGEGVADMMEVLIDQRNEVVLDDIRDALAEARDGEGPETIAAFYGAGHLAEMERSLVEMGFEPVDTEWLDAIGVEPESTGMSREQLASMRTMMQRMIESQTRMLRSMEESGD